MPADALRPSTRRCRTPPACRWSWSARPTWRTATSATSVALRLARRAAAAARARRGARRRVRGGRRSRARRGRGPRFRQPLGRGTRGSAAAVSEIVERGEDFGRASRAIGGGSRSSWCRRTRLADRASRRRGTARTATSVARLLATRRSRGRAGVLLQRRRRADGPVSRVRRGAAAGRRAAPGRYPGDYVRELAAEDGDPVPRMLEQIEATLERFRIHFDRGRVSVLEARIGAMLDSLPTYEEDGAVWVRSSEYGDDSDQVIIRSSEKAGSRRTPRGRHRLPRRQAPARVRPSRLRARRRPPRHAQLVRRRRRGCSATTPGASRCSSYQLVHLAGRRADEDVEARGDVVFLDELLDDVGVDAGPLVPRRPRARPDDRDRRRPRRCATRKNAVYYVQYAHARIARNPAQGRRRSPRRREARPARRSRSASS